LTNAGSDLGSAVKNFKKSMHEGEDEAGKQSKPADAIDGEARTGPPTDASSTADNKASSEHKV